jgi:uncharacterized protein DUF4303
MQDGSRARAGQHPPAGRVSPLISAYAALLVLWAILEIRDLRRSGYPAPVLVAEIVVDLCLCAGLVAYAAGLALPLRSLWAALIPMIAGAAVALRILAFKNEETDLALSPGANRWAHLLALAVGLILMAPAVYMTARVVFPGGLWPTPTVAVAGGVCLGTVFGLRASRFPGVFPSEQARRWKRVEDELYGASVDALESFARDHPGETYYGFMFDCNADYGEVLLCLNTEEDLAERSRRHYPTYSQGEIDAELRWNPGDWRYQGFNTTPPYAEAWDARWSAPQETIASARLVGEEDEVNEEFLTTVCRVLVRMERNGVFDCLVRDNRFKVFVSDHDEAPEDAGTRLLRVRHDAGAG